MAIIRQHIQSSGSTIYRRFFFSGRLTTTPPTTTTTLPLSSALFRPDTSASNVAFCHLRYWNRSQRLSLSPLSSTPSSRYFSITTFRTRSGAPDTSDKMTSSSGLEQISTANSAAPAAPYSQAIKANGQIWVSGQVHINENGKMEEGSVTERTRQCCKNVKAIIDAAGSSMDKVVRVGIFLVDMSDFKEMNEEYKNWFPHKPARACVAVHQLPLGCTVEIEAIALA